MPELPDVEYFRKKSRRALNKKIKKVKVSCKKILESSEKNLKKNLESKKLTKTKRRGKYLFYKTDGGKFLVLHFGMTGYISYYKEEKPEHLALELDFENGYKLGIISIRKLGKINIVKNFEQFVKEKKLGKDALKINNNEFEKILTESKGAIKSTLMNQNKIAGIGNIYSDEILFQAGVHPKEKVKELDKKTRGKIFKEMKKVLETAVKKNAEREKMPKNYLIKKRDDIAKRKNVKCPKCGGKLKHISVGGRSTYFCSKHQEKK